jgi:hypothetical protein
MRKQKAVREKEDWVYVEKRNEFIANNLMKNSVF